MVKTRKPITTVSLPGSQAGGATTSRSELKSLTQYSSRRKALDGPAMRPDTPLAVENSVGKLAASFARRLMPAWERECGELPSPDLSLSGRKAGQGLFVFRGAAGCSVVSALPLKFG